MFALLSATFTELHEYFLHSYLMLALVLMDNLTWAFFTPHKNWLKSATLIDTDLRAEHLIEVVALVKFDLLKSKHFSSYLNALNMNKHTTSQSVTVRTVCWKSDRQWKSNGEADLTPASKCFVYQDLQNTQDLRNRQISKFLFFRLGVSVLEFPHIRFFTELHFTCCLVYRQPVALR